MRLRVIFQKEPYWITLIEGVDVKIKPVTKVEQAAARAFARRKADALIKEDKDIRSVGGDITGQPDYGNPDVSDAVDELLYAQGLARQIILEWKGVGDEEGVDLELNEENIDNVMRLPYVGDLFLAKAQEQIMKMLSEGNDSAS